MQVFLQNILVHDFYFDNFLSISTSLYNNAVNTPIQIDISLTFLATELYPPKKKFDTIYISIKHTLGDGYEQTTSFSYNPNWK